MRAPLHWIIRLLPLAMVTVALPLAANEPAREVPKAEPQPLRFLTDGVARCVAIHPQSSQWAVGTLAGKVVIRQLPKGEVKQVIAAHESPICCLAYSADGRYLCSSDWLFTVKIWDLTSGQLVSTVPALPTSLFLAVFSADGKTLYGFSKFCCLYAWEVASGKELYRKQFPDRCGVNLYGNNTGLILRPDAPLQREKIDLTNGTVAWSREYPDRNDNVRSALTPDGKTLICANATKQAVELYDWTTGEKRDSVPLQMFEGHEKPWVSVAPDSRTAIISSMHTGLAMLLDLTTRKLSNAPWNLAPDLRKFMPGAFMDGDSQHYWGVYADDTRWVRVDLASHDVVGAITAPVPFYWPDIALSPDGRFVAGLRHLLDAPCEVWDCTTGKPLYTTPTLFFQQNKFIAFSADSSQLCLGAGNMGEDRYFFAAATGRFETQPRPQVVTFIRENFREQIRRAFLSGTHWVQLHDNWEAKKQTLRVIDFTGTQELGAYPLPGEAVPDIVAYAPRQRLLALGFREGRLQMASLESGALVKELSAAGKFLQQIQFSADGSYMLCTSSQSNEFLGYEELMKICDYLWSEPVLEVWDTRTWERVANLADARLRDVYFLPDNQRILCALQDYALAVFDLSQKRLISETLPGTPRKVEVVNDGALRVSADGKRAITRWWDGRLVYWQIP